MAKYRITGPDGATYEITAPEGATEADVLNYAKSQTKPKFEQIDVNGPKPQEMSVMEGIGEVAMGGLRGASRIGNTLMRPLDAAGLTGRTNEERKASTEQFFGENADTDSGLFKTGDIAAQIAGTAGAGGVLGKMVMGASKVVPALANVAPKVATALQTGGLRLNPANMVGPMAPVSAMGRVGNAALRTGAGAVTGGAMAGLVDPEQTGTGALIGGALPGGVKVAGAVGNAISKGAKTLGSNLLGTTTGAGSEAVRNAYRAGKTGATEFLDNMRGNSSFDDVVTRAKEGLQKMRLDRGNQYRSGMIDIKADKQAIDMTPINNVVKNITSMGSFKGQQINKNAAGIVKELDDAVSNWSKLDPKEFHTPEGLDALKQSIGDIRDATQFGTAARRAADSVYNAIKQQIEKQAPTYSKVMKDYTEASATLSEVEKALSLGSKASKDTAIRKLQSLMRNNAQTNYGNRLNLANTLETQGGVSLTPAIAGQAMNSMTPRGLTGAINTGGIGVASLMGNPLALAALPATSPRLVGETMYGLGRASGGVQGILQNIMPQGINGPTGLLGNSALLRAAPIPILAAQEAQR